MASTPTTGRACRQRCRLSSLKDWTRAKQVRRTCCQLLMLTPCAGCRTHCQQSEHGLRHQQVLRWHPERPDLGEADVWIRSILFGTRNNRLFAVGFGVLVHAAMVHERLRSRSWVAGLCQSSSSVVLSSVCSLFYRLRKQEVATIFMSFRQFGTWWSVLSASANLSGGISPFIAAYFILHFGWRVSVLVSGAVSLVMGVVSFCTIINSPTDVGMVTFAKPPRKESVSSK